MRVFGLIAGLVLAAVPLGIATSVYARGGAAERAETARIHAHFDSVLVELHARDVSGLSAVQRARRGQLIRALDLYRQRGKFPHNYDFPGKQVPYFVDRETGTLCAVANLLAVTGRRDIVDRVASVNNNVWVVQLARDTAFTTWLDAHGLTLGEAARIQVPYGMTGLNRETMGVPNAAYIAALPIAVGAAAVTGIWNSAGNADGHRRVVSWTGVATGALALGAGAVLYAQRGDMPEGVPAFAATSAAVGGVSVLLSAQSIRRHRRIVAEREAAQRALVAEATFAPIVGGLTESHPTFGASLSLRF